MLRAAELYRDGKSLRQTAAALRASNKAVMTALRYLGVPMRNQRKATSEFLRERHQRRPMVATVFDLGAL
jgi:hypothetical protein